MHADGLPVGERKWSFQMTTLAGLSACILPRAVYRSPLETAAAISKDMKDLP
jgi:hypothetical protein